jgi:hypothetical protein
VSARSRSSSDSRSSFSDAPPVAAPPRRPGVVERGLPGPLHHAAHPVCGVIEDEGGGG